jgi:hypothetical protein
LRYAELAFELALRDLRCPALAAGFEEANLNIRVCEVNRDAMIECEDYVRVGRWAMDSELWLIQESLSLTGRLDDKRSRLELRALRDRIVNGESSELWAAWRKWEDMTCLGTARKHAD